MVGRKHQRYPQYKSLPVAWLAMLPAGWEAQRLKFCAQLVNAKVAEAEQDFYVALENVEPSSGRYVPSELIGEPESVVSRFAVDDVLFGKLRPYLAKAWQAEKAGVCSTEFFVLRGKKYAPAFLRWLCLSPGFVGQVDGSTFGSKMPRASWDDVGELPTPLPPPHEQRAIAAFLDRETALIDALIEKKHRLIELLQEKRAAVIFSAVTKGLSGSATISTESIQHSPLKPSGVDWIGHVPAHWEVGNLRRFARMKTGHTPSRTQPEYWEDCDVPWFTLADVWQLRDGTRIWLGETKERISQLGLASSAAELLPAGTVVFSRTASVGFSGIMPVPMATTQDFWNWVPGPKLRSEFLLYQFRAMSQEFQKLTMGSTHKTIYQSDAAAICVCVPPLDEQIAIVDFIRAETAKIDGLVTKVESVIERLTEYRSALIAAAVTGQIVVREAA